MTPEERAKTIIGHVIERGGRDLDTIVQTIRAAVAEEREACACLAESGVAKDGCGDVASGRIAVAIRARMRNETERAE